MFVVQYGNWKLKNAGLFITQQNQNKTLKLQQFCRMLEVLYYKMAGAIDRSDYRQVLYILSKFYKINLLKSNSIKLKFSCSMENKIFFQKPGFLNYVSVLLFVSTARRAIYSISILVRDPWILFNRFLQPNIFRNPLTSPWFGD